MAHILPTSDDDDHSLLATSYSTMDSSVEDIKPDLTLLGQLMPLHPLTSRALEETGESCDEDSFSPDPGGAQEGGAGVGGVKAEQGGGGGKAEKKGSKKGSKKGGMKGLKGAAGDDSFTIGTLSACRTPKKLQGHLTSSLLEEVLNEKKMALLRSPEVMEQLQYLQEDIRVSHKEQPQGTATSPRVDAKTTRGQHQPDRESRETKGTARHGETSSDRPPNQDDGGDGGGAGTSGAGSSSTIVWSKEGSAFTSVASTTTPGSNTET